MQAIPQELEIVPRLTASHWRNASGHGHNEQAQPYPLGTPSRSESAGMARVPARQATRARATRAREATAMFARTWTRSEGGATSGGWGRVVAGRNVLCRGRIYPPPLHLPSSAESQRQVWPCSEPAQPEVFFGQNCQCVRGWVAWVPSRPGTSVVWSGPARSNRPLFPDAVFVKVSQTTKNASRWTP